MSQVTIREQLYVQQEQSRITNTKAMTICAANV